MFGRSDQRDSLTRTCGAAEGCLIVELTLTQRRGGAERVLGMKRRVGLMFFLMASWALGALELAMPFSDHGVLQAGKILPVWGTALPGSEVRVTLGERGKATTASADGFWQVEFEPTEASGVGVTLEVVAGDERLEREDLVFGEVWIATGQSNMRWMLKDCATGQEAMMKGEDAGLRVFNFQGRLHPGGARFSREFLSGLKESNYYESEGWQRASAKSLAEFSGVGYFFARKLREELDVPVGVIHLGVGGSPIEAHLPRGAFLRDERLKGLLHEWWENPEYPSWCRKRAALNLTEWFKNPVKGMAPPHPFAPTFLWNSGIAPLLPFPVKGVLWYQGESNATLDGGRGAPASKEVNRRKFEALIKSWRGAWRNDELPVYYVQLPGLNRDWPVFREMQFEVSQEVPGVGMAVTIDVGHPTNVHPKRKRPVGERLAGLALAKTYGKVVASESPRVMKIRPNSEILFLDFDQVVKTSDGGPPAGFEIAGENRFFHPAEGDVSGESLALRSEEVPLPVAVRYAWANDPQCNLINKEGLPASPFRSDDWPVRKGGRIRVSCLGDSITAGHGIVNSEERYPSVLGDLLGKDYEVKNFGDSGRGVVRRSMRGSERRALVFMAEHEQSLEFEPDIVICNLGINDLMDWEAFGKDDFVKDYRSLVRSYRELPGKPRVILWQRLAPLFPGQAFFGSESVDGINAAIGQVAKLEGVETVDMQNPLESHGEWFPDHLHPNADGARAIAEVMAGYLKVSK
jgi:lysophospholipase L1-like esterase